MAENLGNDYTTTLTGALDGSQTNVAVASGTGAPAANFRIRIDDEIMLVTSVGGGTNWTVTRNIEGTAGAAHSNGATVAHVVTKGGLDQYTFERYLNRDTNLTYDGASTIGPALTLGPYAAAQTEIWGADYTATHQVGLIYTGADLGAGTSGNAGLFETVADPSTDCPNMAFGSIGADLVVKSTNTKDIGYLYTIYSAGEHRGSGTVGEFRGNSQYMSVAGTGGAGYVVAMEADVRATNTGVITDAVGVYAYLQTTNSGTMTNATGVKIDVSGVAGATNLYGVHQTGASAKNVFAGSLRGNGITNDALTAGRVVYSGTAGLEVDSANLTYTDAGTVGPELTVGPFLAARAALSWPYANTGLIQAGTIYTGGDGPTNVSGLFLAVVADPSADTPFTHFNGIEFGLSSKTGNTTHLSWMTGYYSAIQHNGSGLLDLMNGMEVYNFVVGGPVTESLGGVFNTIVYSSGSVANAIGLKTLLYSGLGGTITTATGVHIDVSAVGGATTLWGVRQLGASAKNEFAGSIRGKGITNDNLTAGRVVYSGTAGLEVDSANLTYSEASGPRLQVGSGTGSTAGLLAGKYGTGDSFAIWSTVAAPTASNYVFLSDLTSGTFINAGSAAETAVIDFKINASTKARVNPGQALGSGFGITAGTATTNVNALSLTQTWNNAAVAFTGIKYTITDTSSAASALALQILGGAAGTTNLFSVSKAGSVVIPDQMVATIGNFATYTLSPSFYSQSNTGLGLVLGLDSVTNVSWISNGLVGVGTGAQGSFAGSLKLTTLIAPDAILNVTGYQGAGLSIAAGTATTNVAALSITQTWNNTACATGFKYTITDTSSAVGALPFQILGTSTGAVNLASLSKAAVLTIGQAGSLNGKIVVGEAASVNAFLTIGGTVSQVMKGENNGVGITWQIVTDNTGSGGVAEFKLGSTGNFMWSSTTAIATMDTNLSRISAGLIGVGTGAQGSFAGSLKVTDLFTNNAAALIKTNTTLTDGAGVGAGTLTTAPTAGNPTKWIGINDNGTTRYIPAW